MKKIAILTMTMLLMLAMVACGSETKTFVAENNGSKTEITLTYKGDKVSVQELTNEVPYTLMGVADKKEAEKLINPLLSKAKNIDGFTDKVEYKKDRIIEKVTIDYDKVDMKKLKQIPGFTNSTGDEKKGISFKETSKMLKGMGFKEAKK